MASSRSRVAELIFRVARRDVERVSAALFAAGAGAVEEREGPSLVVWVTSEAEAATLTAAVPGVVPRRRDLDPGWRTEWMRWLVPVALTERIVLQPIHDRSVAPRGKRRLWYAPDQAFGVGSHATTRLAARWTERLCRARRGASVLDVGTGNGVLALVALVSGAGRALGIDIDPVAVRAARRNARLNRLAGRCAFSTRPLARVRGQHDLVLANIELWVLLELAPALAGVLAPEGRLVLSGMLADRADEVVARFGQVGLGERGREEEDGWLGLVLGRSGK